MTRSDLQVLLSIVLFYAAATATAQRHNDTGQITCYDFGDSTGTVAPGTADPEPALYNEQDCTRGAAAADALGRMVKVGGSSVPGRDYSKIANDGRVLGASATLGAGPTDWACTRDNITGLIWEIKVDDAANLRHREHRYTWYDTDTAINGGNPGTEASNECNGTLMNCNTTAYRDAINALTGSNRLCGATDWRLPTANELSSLVNFSVVLPPAIDGSWFPNTAVATFWSAETAADVSRGWTVDFGFGGIGYDSKDLSGRIRLVRDAQ